MKTAQLKALLPDEGATEISICIHNHFSQRDIKIETSILMLQKCFKNKLTKKEKVAGHMLTQDIALTQ